MFLAAVTILAAVVPATGSIPAARFKKSAVKNPIMLA
jgi:hypothetical protein